MSNASSCRDPRGRFPAGQQPRADRIIVGRFLMSPRSALKILALDTSTEYCSAALWLGGSVVHDGVHAGQRHSELLLPMIDGLLAGAGLGLDALDAIAFGEGPGSFTGLRIACGVAQGLAFGADLPVIGVGTLLALAEASGANEAACCLDARMKQVYFAAFRRTDQAWETVQAPGLYAPDQLPRLPPGAWIGCGNGFAVHGDALARSLGEPLRGLAAVSVPHARDIAKLAAFDFARGAARPAEQALPVYIRDKVALTIEEQR
jgi:tRNA threonylcarbamoyladenosine biosynthesis protein TsaB